MSLSRGIGLFHQYLKRANVGDIISARELRDACGWSESTLKTYVTKNKLRRFLVQHESGGFEVIRAGPDLPEQEVARALTQVSHAPVVLRENDELKSDQDSYKLIREFGRGAVGHVWLAESGCGGNVAVKILNPRQDLLEPTNLANIKRRFQREARNGLKLSSEYLIGILDSGDYQGQPFMVMECAERSLADELSTTGALSREEANMALLAALEGLRYLHAKRCVHRDVKPANLLRIRSTVVFGDLGIVKWSDLNPEFTSAGTITRASVQLGSWHYMAPEQLVDPHEAIPASDIYSLGVTWFELLTGDKASPHAFGARKLPPNDCDEEITELILAMTAYSPDDRPTMSDILQRAHAIAGR